MKRDDNESFVLYTLIMCVFALAACVLGAWLMQQTAQGQDDLRNDVNTAQAVKSPSVNRARLSSTDSRERPATSPAAMVQPAAVSGHHFGDGAENADGGTVILLLAQVCWLEATFRVTDCAAIHYVIERRAKRSGWTYERMLREYSAIDSDTARAQAARSLPDGDVGAWSERDNGRWRNVRDVAAGSLAGQVRNPCPGALHWAGRAIEGDRKRIDAALASGRHVVVQCDTANVFLKERR